MTFYNTAALQGGFIPHPYIGFNPGIRDLDRQSLPSPVHLDEQEDIDSFRISLEQSGKKLFNEIKDKLKPKKRKQFSDACSNAYDLIKTFLNKESPFNTLPENTKRKTAINVFNYSLALNYLLDSYSVLIKKYNDKINQIKKKYKKNEKMHLVDASEIANLRSILNGLRGNVRKIHYYFSSMKDNQVYRLYKLGIVLTLRILRGEYPPYFSPEIDSVYNVNDAVPYMPGYDLSVIKRRAIPKRGSMKVRRERKRIAPPEGIKKEGDDIIYPILKGEFKPLPPKKPKKKREPPKGVRREGDDILYPILS